MESLQGQEIVIFQQGSTTPLGSWETLIASEETTYYAYEKFA
jgi:hypothetical protein